MPTRVSRAPWLGLLGGLLLVAAAFAVPKLADWQVYARSRISSDDIPPLPGLWHPQWFGQGTLPAVVIAVLGARFGFAVAQRIGWRKLLVASYVVGLAWLLSLAYVDGSDGISSVLGNKFEYLQSARAVHDIPGTLQEFVSRIPLSAKPDNWPTHVSAHPPGALLFFVLLVRVGLGGDYAAGMVVTVLAATTAPAVLVTMRALGREELARRVAPILVLSPAAIFTAVSADGLFAAVAAWAMAALAIATSRERTGPMVAWSVLAGLLFGATVMLSYGLGLFALVALAVPLATRTWRPVPVVAVSAAAVVLAFVPFGFSWWEAYPVLNDRYWDSFAKVRPALYWWWGDLALLLISAGPLLAAGLARLAVVRRSADPVVRALVAGALLAVLVADASRMSKAEVERIWLPFVPWLLLACALLPERWRRWGLVLQVVVALLVQHLFFNPW